MRYSGIHAYVCVVQTVVKDFWLKVLWQFLDTETLARFSKVKIKDRKNGTGMNPLSLTFERAQPYNQTGLLATWIPNLTVWLWVRDYMNTCGESDIDWVQFGYFQLHHQMHLFQVYWHQQRETIFARTKREKNRRQLVLRKHEPVRRPFFLLSRKQILFPEVAKQENILTGNNVSATSPSLPRVQVCGKQDDVTDGRYNWRT